MSYVHHIPGRIRVRSAAVKANPSRAAALRRWLESMKGVERVEVSPVTGSVLIHYRAGLTEGGRLLARMRERGWISSATPEQSKASRSGAATLASRTIEQAVASTILKYAAEVAIERSVFALAAALL